MDRESLKTYISEAYSAGPDFPWAKYPQYAVFRHTDNRKWFAIIMEVPKKKLGLPEDGALDILNVKCDPILIGSFREEPGIYPAYHMSKESWLSVALDGRVNDEKLKLLLDISFHLTAQKPKKGGNTKPQASSPVSPRK